LKLGLIDWLNAEDTHSIKKKQRYAILIYSAITVASAVFSLIFFIAYLMAGIFLFFIGTIAYLIIGFVAWRYIHKYTNIATPSGTYED